METTIKKPKLGKNVGVECNLYEARSTKEQMFDTDAIAKMRENLKEINPQIPMINALWNSVAPDVWCETKFGTVPIFSPLAYQCSKVGNNFKVYINIETKIPSTEAVSDNYPDFPHCNIPQYYYHDLSTLDSAQKATLDKIHMTSEQAVVLEQATQLQSQSTLWFEEKKCRITASKVYDVFQWKRGLDKHAEKFVGKDSANMEVSEFLKKKLEHGKMYESVALEKYKVCMKEEFPNIEVYPCGLVVSEKNCWLGSSPDGKVVCGDIFGIAECKCPEQYKLSDVFDVASSNESGNFMLFVKNNKLHLRESHPTYYQIQCQLALTGSNFCDLIVYTFRSIAIIRVIRLMHSFGQK